MKWCDKCAEDTAAYHVTYRTDEHVPKWSTVNGEQYTQNVCRDCMGAVLSEVERGEIWSVHTQAI